MTSTEDREQWHADESTPSDMSVWRDRGVIIADLIRDNETLRAEVERLRDREQGGNWLARDLMTDVDTLRARAESAEAVVRDVEALADEWGRRYVKANGPTRLTTTRAMADYAQGRADTWQEGERDLRAVLARSQAPQAPAAQEGRAKVITLCGSTRFKDEFHSWNSRLTLEGSVVISVGVFGHGMHPYHQEKYLDPKKPMLDRLHFQKIDMADEVFVIDPSGYVGESTAREIAYAESLGKPVRRLSVVDPSCETCGRDNRNGTHDAMERVGHLSHPFAPSVRPDATADDDA